MGTLDSMVQGKRLAGKKSRLDRQLAPFHTIDIHMLSPFGPS
ncbi:hypothetical protein SAMN05216466_11445 [Paraburkholderia phenazinium]|jgi:hypothetical protein|uniref:Uncharacterized protein n=1 Tax=Paraburkholderia phenazinium TaxID=60549 RepID=A0A1G8FY58_9BURK|nr:hypothetical protein SAMN05216466_11445 [Paraburkholderia phenazinium]